MECVVERLVRRFKKKEKKKKVKFTYLIRGSQVQSALERQLAKPLTTPSDLYTFTI